MSPGTVKDSSLATHILFWIKPALAHHDVVGLRLNMSLNSSCVKTGGMRAEVFRCLLESVTGNSFTYSCGN